MAISASPVRPSTHTLREPERRALPARSITCRNGDVNLDHVFVCGNPALDFAATLRARRSTRFEMFAAPDRLDAWYRESGVVDAVSPSTEADVEQATTVREAVYQLVTARRLGEEYDTGALAVLNSAARKPPAVPQLTPSGRWTQADPDEALSTVARLAVELLSGPDVPLLKECGNPECTRIYIDRSRGMRRQWCGMESCGNKIKAAAYRARKKSVSP
jgi:predicted RNA-binding Zn ribbon-like protein